MIPLLFEELGSWEFSVKKLSTSVSPLHTGLRCSPKRWPTNVATNRRATPDLKRN